MDGRIDRWMEGGMSRYRWMDGSIDTVDGWMDRWREKTPTTYLI